SVSITVNYAVIELLLQHIADQLEYLALKLSFRLRRITWIDRDYLYKSFLSHMKNLKQFHFYLTCSMIPTILNEATTSTQIISTFRNNFWLNDKMFLVGCYLDHFRDVSHLCYIRYHFIMIKYHTCQIIF
ncbi:unnamed protein product, partial [Didymodactylos carnosus]